MFRAHGAQVHGFDFFQRAPLHVFVAGRFQQGGDFGRVVVGHQRQVVAGAGVVHLVPQVVPRLAHVVALVPAFGIPGAVKHGHERAGLEQFFGGGERAHGVGQRPEQVAAHDGVVRFGGARGMGGVAQFKGDVQPFGLGIFARALEHVFGHVDAAHLIAHAREVDTDKTRPAAQIQHIGGRRRHDAGKLFAPCGISGFAVIARGVHGIGVVLLRALGVVPVIRYLIADRGFVLLDELAPLDAHQHAVVKALPDGAHFGAARLAQRQHVQRKGVEVGVVAAAITRVGIGLAARALGKGGLQGGLLLGGLPPAVPIHHVRLRQGEFEGAVFVGLGQVDGDAIRAVIG